MPEDTRAEYLAEGGDVPDPDVGILRDVLGAKETWAEPPLAVSENVLGAIRSETGSAGTRSSSRWLRFAGVAAAILLVTSLVVLWPSSRSEVVLAGTNLLPDGGGVATLDATGAGWEIDLDLDLPPAEPGYYYEGWVWNDQGEGVSIGTFHLRGNNSPVTLWAGVDVNEYPSIWVSLQEEGGGPQLSDRILLKGRFEPAER